MSANGRFLFLLVPLCGCSTGSGETTREEKASVVVLDPKPLTVHVHFTNHTNPEIYDPTASPPTGILASMGFYQAYVSATSVSPVGFRSDSGYLKPTNSHMTATGVDWTLSAEGDDGSGGPVQYNVGATAWDLAKVSPNGPSGNGNGQFYFPQRSVSLGSAGATVDLGTCVGVQRFHFKNAAGEDVIPSAGSSWMFTPYGFNFFNGSGTPSSTGYFLLPDGVDHVGQMVLTFGTDVFTDLVYFYPTVAMHSVCDQINDIDVGVDVSVTSFGAATGPFDVIGEHPPSFVRPTAQVRLYGANGNQRFVNITANPPEIAPADTANYWRAENLVPGKWGGLAYGYVRSGNGGTAFATTRFGTGSPIAGATSTITAGATSDMTVAGVAPFHMTPAYFSGQIRLRDSFPVTHSGAASGLSNVFRWVTFSPRDGYGNPSFPSDDVTLLQSNIVAREHVVGVGSSATSFDGDYSPTTGMLDSSYTQVIAQARNAPHPWTQDHLRLFFWSEAPSHYYLDFPGPGDPATFQQGLLLIKRPDATVASVVPGNTYTFNYDVCFSDVALPLVTATGGMLNPRVSVVSGHHGGSVPYDVLASSYFSGTPAIGGRASGVDRRALARANGLVRLTLPEGRYTLQPSAEIVLPDGTSSTASFPVFNVDVGCGNRYDIAQGLAISLNTTSPVSTATEAATGSVDSGTVPVDHIWYTVNGGPPTDICSSDCGASPTFNFELPLACGTNTVVAYAHAPDLGRTTSVTTTIVRDH